MNDFSGLSSVTSITKAGQLTSKVEVSMETVPHISSERILLDAKQIEVGKMEQCLAMSFEIRNEMETHLNYLALWSSKEI